MPPPLCHEFTPLDVEVTDTETTHDGFFTMKRHTLRHRLYRGPWSAELTREVFYTGPAVTLLPYDPETDSVLLVEQFRYAVHATRPAPWLIEVIAGRIDTGETAEAAALREAREEADIDVEDLTLIGALYPAPGYTDELLHHFCARADLSGGGGIHGLEAEQEDIRALVLPFADAMAAVKSGEINTGPAVASLYWLALNREDLREQWAA